MLHIIYEQHKDMFPLNETSIRGLHYELMRYYQASGPNIGRYKVQPNYIVESSKSLKQLKVIFQTADAGPITETAMHDLIE